MSVSMHFYSLSMSYKALAAFALWMIVSSGATAAAGLVADQQQIDGAVCSAAVASGDDEKIIHACGRLIDDDKTTKTDRTHALIARALAYDRMGQLDRAIADYT